MTRPITIAGGGLAGLALGIALARRGVQVSLHEAGAYPRHRVCGEFLSGVTDATLEKLGIAHLLAPARRLESARWFDANGAVCDLAVPALGISRWKLDDDLQRDFQKSGGKLHTHSRIPPGEGIVWAAGRPRRESDWIGLKCHVENLDMAADLEMHVGTNGYAGLARVEDNIVNVCGLFRKSPGVGGRQALFQCLEAGGLSVLADRVRSASPSDFCAVAGFRTGPQRGPSFAIGDASAMIPPFTGNGMTMALQSAETALDPTLEYAAGRISWREASETVSSLLSKRFSRRLKVAGLLHAALTSRPALLCSLARRRILPAAFFLRLVR